jgi:hypothetical protein
VGTNILPEGSYDGFVRSNFEIIDIYDHKRFGLVVKIYRAPIVELAPSALANTILAVFFPKSAGLRVTVQIVNEWYKRVRETTLPLFGPPVAR